MKVIGLAVNQRRPERHEITGCQLVGAFPKVVARFFGPIAAFRFHGPRYGRQLPQTYVPIVHNCAKYNVTRQGVYMSLHYGVDLVGH